eukprot:scaffold89098_cov30-Prasinocladus_malaysianus.AAC.1
MRDKLITRYLPYRQANGGTLPTAPIFIAPCWRAAVASGRLDRRQESLQAIGWPSTCQGFLLWSRLSPRLSPPRETRYEYEHNRTWPVTLLCGCTPHGNELRIDTNCLRRSMARYIPSRCATGLRSAGPKPFLFPIFPSP